MYIIQNSSEIRIGVVYKVKHLSIEQPNLDNIIGKFHAQSFITDCCQFNFGIGRTQGNYICDSEDIYLELDAESQKNLMDNLVRWTWTRSNKLHHYFSHKEIDALIQPIVFYDRFEKTFSVTGGEVFIGEKVYTNFPELMKDVPTDKYKPRIELLVLEKLIQACNNIPGLLKFNLSPQTLIDKFSEKRKVSRFISLIKKNNLDPKNIRIELVENSYEEKNVSLKEICNTFWQQGVSFAADDFGVKSQSHQIVLDLGEIIKEFKLDPMSFKFRIDEDQTKFLDNLAFIDYCKRLADNRNASITAEAFKEFESLKFLIAHHVFYFQSFLLVKKITIQQYVELFDSMQNLPEEAVYTILQNKDYLKRQDEIGNIFLLAKELELT